MLIIRSVVHPLLFQGCRRIAREAFLEFCQANRHAGQLSSTITTDTKDLGQDYLAQTN